MRRTPDVTRSLFGVPQQTQSAKAEVYYLRFSAACCSAFCLGSKSARWVHCACHCSFWHRVVNTKRGQSHFEMPLFADSSFDETGSQLVLANASQIGIVPTNFDSSLKE